MDQESVQPAPEAWVGQTVVVGIGTGNARVSGVLHEVNDKGVVVYIGPESTRAPSYSFYPWGMVRGINLPDTERSQQSDDIEPTPT